MNRLKFVERTYKEFIAKKFGKNLKLYSFFKNHERLPLVFENWATQLKEIDEKDLKHFTAGDYKLVVEQSAMMFCRLAINKKEQELKYWYANSKLLDEYGNPLKDPIKDPGTPEGVIEVDDRFTNKLNTKLRGI